MKRSSLAAIIIIGLLVVFLVLAFSIGDNEENSEDIDVYFQEQIWQKAVSNNGGMMPIEGFDPDLYMGAYSNLTVEDFDGVEAIGGKWELRNQELVFVRDNSGEITSADGTLNEEGLSQLLINLEERLSRDIKTKQDVDFLLIQLSNQDMTLCDPESRQAEACIMIYDPVCGYFGQNIQCITAPCAQTYSNECQACMDANVEYWIKGECPVNPFNPSNSTDDNTDNTENSTTGGIGY